MIILEVTHKNHHSSIPESIVSNGVEYMSTINVRPAFLSSLTAMRIATACKKNAVDIVVVHRKADAMAAISARRLGYGFKIMFYVEQFDRVPISIPAEICTGVDVWAFDCAETRDRWSHIEKHCFKSTVILPYPTGLNMDNIYESVEKDKLTATYSGNLEHPHNLKDFIEAVHRHGLRDRIKITVYGTAKPRTIMPVVKLARLYKIDVDWAGERTEDLSILPDGIIPGGHALAPAELHRVSKGVPVVTAHNLERWTQTDGRREMSGHCAGMLEPYGMDAFYNQLQRITSC